MFFPWVCILFSLRILTSNSNRWYKCCSYGEETFADTINGMKRTLTLWPLAYVLQSPLCPPCLSTYEIWILSQSLDYDTQGSSEHGECIEWWAWDGEALVGVNISDSTTSSLQLHRLIGVSMATNEVQLVESFNLKGGRRHKLRTSLLPYWWIGGWSLEIWSFPSFNVHVDMWILVKVLRNHCLYHEKNEVWYASRKSAQFGGNAHYCT